MKKGRDYLLILVSVCITHYCICSHALCANVHEYTLGAQDVLKIEVWDNPDLSTTAEVLSNGTISFPLIGEIKVEGLTIEKLQRLIRSRLADGFLVNPQVTVSIKEYNNKKIYVLGEVKSPGNYPFSKMTTMVELISMAGGLTRDAGREAYIWRAPQGDVEPDEDRNINNEDEGKRAPSRRKNSQDNLSALNEHHLSENMMEGQFITINLDDFNQGINLDFELKNNDTLYVPKAKFLYVTGEVKVPGRYKLEKEINVLQAISLAGGFTQKANEKKVKVLRTIKGKAKEIRISMTDQILPDDIIKVPSNFF